MVYPNGKFAGLDSNSGGYPYPTDNLNNVKFWTSLEEAKTHQAMFKELVIHKFTWDSVEYHEM
jgi:hypothetical protein